MQAKVYREVKANYDLYSEEPDKMPQMSVAPVVTSSQFYRPKVDREKLNLLTSPTKAVSQQTAPRNIKAYLTKTVKTTAIDLGNVNPVYGAESSRAYGTQGSNANKVRFQKKKF